jgi:hypothetical protein
MNHELISELYRFAVEQTALDHPGVSPAPAWSWEENFARLIVQECVNVMSRTEDTANREHTYMGDDVPTCVHQINILTHFGLN